MRFESDWVSLLCDEYSVTSTLSKGSVVDFCPSTPIQLRYSACFASSQFVLCNDSWVLG
jgi:hypothetical protein